MVVMVDQSSQTLSSREYIQTLRQKRLRKWQGDDAVDDTADQPTSNDYHQQDEQAPPQNQNYDADTAPSSTTTSELYRPISVPQHTPPKVDPVHHQSRSQATSVFQSGQQFREQPVKRQQTAEPQESTNQQPTQQQSQFAQDQDPQTEPTQSTNRRSAFDESQLFPGQFKPIPEKTIITWKAPSRPFKQHNRQFFSTMVIIALLISLILFFTGQFLPIAVVVAVAFLVYVLYTIPPEEIRFKITTYGVHIAKELYYWEELGRFWFDVKFGQEVMYIETARFPGRLMMLLGPQSKDELTNVLSEVLLEEEPKKTFYDKAALWLQEKIPLE